MQESSNYQNTFSRWQQAREQQLQAALDAAKTVVKALQDKDITSIEFAYSGSSDNGCIDDCFAEGAGTLSSEEEKVLENLVYALLPSGWEIDGGSEGTVTFDLETGKISRAHKWLEYVEDDSFPVAQLYLSDE